MTRGLHVMKGYLNAPDATASVFSGGWLHTGDLGYFDQDGFLFIVGRQKELIIRGGYNVYPREIEDVLHAHPAVAEAAVIGIPHERLGEEVMAVVTVRDGAAVTEAELRAYCRERVAAYKYPRRFEFRAQLPKNSLGKVLKDELLPLRPVASTAASSGPQPAQEGQAMERMSTLDAGFFYVEHDNVPMHLGSLALFEGPAPSYEELIRLIAAKLPRVPRYRQVVRTMPLEVLRPMWVDDGHFEIGHHVRHAAVPAPGGKRQLRELAARIFATPLDRARPLWEAWLLEGLKGGRWAILSKVHHCVVDGIGGNDLMTAIFDLGPDAQCPAPAVWVPEPEPAMMDLMAASLREAAAGSVRQMAALSGLLSQPLPPPGEHPGVRARPGRRGAPPRGPVGGLAERADRPEPAVGVGRRRPGRGEGDPLRARRNGQRRPARGDHPRVP